MDEKLNIVLKEMWRIDEKNKNGGGLTEEESVFYVSHMDIIVKYYQSNSRYWLSKSGKNDVYS